MGGIARRGPGKQGGDAGKGRWPDWTGETVVIAASGPSQRQEDIEAARGQAVVVVINETWRLAPWADALYACDERWWRLRGPSDAEFTGLRFIGKGDWPGCMPCGVDAAWSGMQWCGRKLGAGGNSGFQAVNLATVAGAARVLLLGFDMRHTGGGKHFHGDHGEGLTNPSQHMLQGCARRLDAASEELEARGVEVINCTRDTALRAYRRAEIRDVI